MNFDDLNFEQELDVTKWQEMQMLHTPTMNAQLDTAGSLTLTGSDIEGNLSVEDTIALTKFLMQFVKLPPEPAPFDMKDIHIRRVDE